MGGGKYKLNIILGEKMKNLGRWLLMSALFFGFVGCGGGGSDALKVEENKKEEVILSIVYEIIKEEQRTIIIPINEKDLDNRIDTVIFTSSLSNIDFNNTKVMININMPKYIDIQEFSMECIAYDIQSEELDRASVLIIVEEKTTTPNIYKPKKTGQTTSYTTYDDGDYQKGISHSYTRDDIKEIVTDHVTGLEWQDDEEAKTLREIWRNAKSYCINKGNAWRLPTVVELESIVDYGAYKPSIFTVFENVSSNYYWSSTTSANASNYYAWNVYFGYGNTYNSNKNDSKYIRCVRAEQ